MTSEELVENAIDIVASFEGKDEAPIDVILSAVVNMVLEEAAKIARSKVIENPDQWCGDESFNAACEEIEEAIRALKSEQMK
jgi:hypothetical protein